MTETYFIEITKNWIDYGYGTMLVYIQKNPSLCEYVMFTKNNRKNILNEDLLKQYNKEV